ncbi:FAD-dependent oxidoreductase [Verrucomicrobium spinosum]|uniref:FAD-dependent oxidoreductase n=1 Tax=Verrucomicrobium spinosum TaxID=2736 RepID=UPI000B192CF9|nr:FAD-dependent oxidoreductase [Verrucomicrobium spinosum]
MTPEEDFPTPRPLKSKNFPQNTTFMPSDLLHGEWFWESGFDKHPIEDLELVRDWNFRAVFGAFSAMRKSNPEKYANYGFQWLAFIGGTRESRLLQGDIVLTQEDIVSKKEFPDGCVPTTWDLDLHYPKEQYMKKYGDNPFISRAAFGKGVDRRNGYPVPYRCFYSKDVENLFMAGRNISVDHNALGSTRVMRTCGMMGEVVGKAAYLCVRHQTSPRVYMSSTWTTSRTSCGNPVPCAAMPSNPPSICPRTPPSFPKLCMTTLPSTPSKALSLTTMTPS